MGFSCDTTFCNSSRLFNILLLTNGFSCVIIIRDNKEKIMKNTEMKNQKRIGQVRVDSSAKSVRGGQVRD